MGNSFGQLFRITTWGESHGGGVGVVIDGCPPRLGLVEADIQPDLDRRRPGQSAIVSPRKEADRVEILSGTFEGRTLGTPISMWVRNEDARPEAYSEMASKFRPSHADYTYQAKYRHPQLAGRGTHQRAGNHRAGRGRRCRQKTSARTHSGLKSSPMCSVCSESRRGWRWTLSNKSRSRPMPSGARIRGRRDG